MEDLHVIFDQIRQLLKKYQPPLASKTDRDGYFDLWSFKQVVIAGRKRKEVFFAGAIIHKSYVGFYFMPVYVDAEIKEVFEPELLSMLKGKSCFYIKENDAEILRQIDQALEMGFEIYQKNGWV